MCFAERACRIVKDGLEGAHASKLYVTSVYWTVTTLSTVGYGDIFASTIAERTYCILVSSSRRVRGMRETAFRSNACCRSITRRSLLDLMGMVEVGEVSSRREMLVCMIAPGASTPPSVRFPGGDPDVPWHDMSFARIALCSTCEQCVDRSSVDLYDS